MSSSIAFSPSIIHLSIGGKKFSTTVDTLTLREPDSMLAAMFSGRHDVSGQKSENGEIFIDRDGEHFRHILNWLRDGILPIMVYRDSMELLREAEYFQLVGLINEIKANNVRSKASFAGSDLTQFDFIRYSQSSNKKVLLQLHGVNLPGIDLSGLDLSGATFSDANLKCANLKGTNLEGANLERAILTDANLEMANLAQSYLSGANLVNANIKNAHLSKAKIGCTNLKGANLKGAYLEGVVIDIDTNLRNANLEATNLLGAKLTFSYSMEGMNLARANLKGSTIRFVCYYGMGPCLLDLKLVASKFGISITGAILDCVNLIQI